MSGIKVWVSISLSNTCIGSTTVTGKERAHGCLSERSAIATTTWTWYRSYCPTRNEIMSPKMVDNHKTTELAPQVMARRGEWLWNRGAPRTYHIIECRLCRIRRHARCDLSRRDHESRDNHSWIVVVGSCLYCVDWDVLCVMRRDYDAWCDCSAGNENPDIRDSNARDSARRELNRSSRRAVTMRPHEEWQSLQETACL